MTPLTVDMARKRCPFGVAETCLTDGCAAWEFEMDEKRRIDPRGVDGAEKAAYVTRIAGELGAQGFVPAPKPNTYIANVPLNWIRSTGERGDCRCLTNHQCGGCGK